MATPWHKTPLGDLKIYNLFTLLGHHYYILGLSDLSLGVEKKDS